VSRSSSNLAPISEQSQSHRYSDGSLRYCDRALVLPVLTSYEAEWNNINLEQHSLQSSGETPNLCFDHYVISINTSQDAQVDYQIDEIAKGCVQRRTTCYGAMTLVPAHHYNWASWDRQIEGLILNLKTDLLTRNAAELLAVDRVELLPYLQICDPLIFQIALALKADLESHKPSGRLYAETMSTTLAVHLVRHYSSHERKGVRYLGG
jgi:AraC family transcriptional regulator